MSSPGQHPWFRNHPIREESIVWHWENATPNEIAHGQNWYGDARTVATVIADGDTHTGAGMLAVYSPQQEWVSNVLNAARALKERTGIGGPGSGIFATTAQKKAANRLLNGERYENVLTSPKVRDFAQLIEFGDDCNPDDPRVVIDRHALSVAHGCALTAHEYARAPVRGSVRADGSISRMHYDYVVRLYHRAAELISRRTNKRVAPHHVQATTWLVRRRLNHKEEHQRDTNLDRGRNQARINATHALREFQKMNLAHHLSSLNAEYV